MTDASVPRTESGQGVIPKKTALTDLVDHALEVYGYVIPPTPL